MKSILGVLAFTASLVEVDWPHMLMIAIDDMRDWTGQQVTHRPRHHRWSGWRIRRVLHTGLNDVCSWQSLTHCTGGVEELYDEQADPHEETSLMPHPERAVLKAEFSKWLPASTASWKKDKKSDSRFPTSDAL